MPNDNYHEVLAIIIAGGIVFLMLTAVITFTLLFYQKKKFQHGQQLTEMERKFTEQMLRSQLEMQEHTFNNISQEIHDNVGQTLSLAKVQLNIMDQDRVANRSILKEAKDSVDKAMTDLRDIAKGLNTERIKSLTLVEMTTHELQRIERLGIIKIKLEMEGDEIRLLDQKRLIVFRIIQESLQNILKHSKAKDIEVIFNFQTDQIKIEISDNGVGFNTGILARKGGLGIQNIMNRASVIDSKVFINSTPGKGTIVTIIIFNVNQKY